MSKQYVELKPAANIKYTPFRHPLNRSIVHHSIMIIKHEIDAEFISICQDILKEDLDLEEWGLIESCDQFQTVNYCGGFDATENEFTFSFFDKKRDEYWFQLPLTDISKVARGIITEVQMKSAH